MLLLLITNSDFVKEIVGRYLAVKGCYDNTRKLDHGLWNLTMRASIRDSKKRD